MTEIRCWRCNRLLAKVEGDASVTMGVIWAKTVEIASLIGIGRRMGGVRGDGLGAPKRRAARMAHGFGKTAACGETCLMGLVDKRDSVSPHAMGFLAARTWRRSSR